MEWLGDGVVQTTMFLPTDERTAYFAAIEVGNKMGLKEVEVIHTEVMQAAEGTRVEIKGKFQHTIDLDTLVVPPPPQIMTFEELCAAIKARPMKIVAATVGEDEHSVGLREVIDIKHGGIEKFGIEVHYLGTSCPIEKLVDAAIELDAQAILASTIISHDDVHYKNMKKIHQYCIEKGVRDKLIVCAGGTQVSPEIALEYGVDQAFGRGSNGTQVATFLVKNREERGL
jgi:D-ornithine 4,5-aminomutase subunit beta